MRLCRLRAALHVIGWFPRSRPQWRCPVSHSSDTSFLPLRPCWDLHSTFPASQKQVAPGASGIIIPSLNHGKNRQCDTPSPHSICSLNLKWGLGVTPLKLHSVLVIVFRWDSGQWCCWVEYLCFYCMEYNICCSCVEYLCCSCVEYLWCSCVECLSCYCVDYLGCSWLISYIQSDSDE